MAIPITVSSTGGRGALTRSAIYVAVMRRHRSAQAQAAMLTVILELVVANTVNLRGRPLMGGPVRSARVALPDPGRPVLPDPGRPVRPVGTTPTRRRRRRPR